MDEETRRLLIGGRVWRQRTSLADFCPGYVPAEGANELAAHLARCKLCMALRLLMTEPPTDEELRSFEAKNMLDQLVRLCLASDG